MNYEMKDRFSHPAIDFNFQPDGIKFEENKTFYEFATNHVEALDVTPLFLKTLILKMYYRLFESLDKKNMHRVNPQIHALLGEGAKDLYFFMLKNFGEKNYGRWDASTVRIFFKYLSIYVTTDKPLDSAIIERGIYINTYETTHFDIEIFTQFFLTGTSSAFLYYNKNAQKINYLHIKKIKDLNPTLSYNMFHTALFFYLNYSYYDLFYDFDPVHSAYQYYIMHTITKNDIHLKHSFLNETQINKLKYYFQPNVLKKLKKYINK